MPSVLRALPLASCAPTQPCPWRVKRLGAHDDNDSYDDGDGINKNKTVTVLRVLGDDCRPLTRLQAVFPVPYMYITSFPDAAGAIIVALSQKRRLNAPDGEVMCPAGKRWNWGFRPSWSSLSPWPNEHLLGPKHSLSLRPAELWPQGDSTSLIPPALGRCAFLHPRVSSQTFSELPVLVL